MRYDFPFVVGFCLPFCIFVHVMHFISCHHGHLFCTRVRLLHPSIFPVVRFASRHSYVHRCAPFVSFRVPVLNILGMDRDLPSGLGTPPVPPVKFRVIWSPFDTPTINRGTIKASCVLPPITPPKWPNNPSKPSPSTRSFDHDRVGENRTSFGLS